MRFAQGVKGKLNRELSTACRTILLLIANVMSVLTPMSEANFLRSVGAQASKLVVLPFLLPFLLPKL